MIQSCLSLSFENKEKPKEQNVNMLAKSPSFTYRAVEATSSFISHLSFVTRTKHNMQVNKKVNMKSKTGPLQGC